MKIIIEGTPEELKKYFQSDDDLEALESLDTGGDNEEELDGEEETEEDEKNKIASSLLFKILRDCMNDIEVVKKFSSGETK